jgi:DNA-directed RNA polymerase specialized sigma24 family protein
MLEAEIPEAELDIRPIEEEPDGDSPLEKQTQGLWSEETLSLEDRVAWNDLWEKFLATLSWEEQLLLQRLAEGYRKNEIARFFRVTPPAVTQRKQRLLAKWREFLKKEQMDDK